MLNKVSQFVFFDDSCGICRRTIDFLQSDNKFPNVQFLGSQLPESIEVMSKYGSDLDTSKYMYYVNDDKEKIFRGYDAFRKLFTMNPKTAVIGYLMYIPGLNVIGKIIYRIVANNRKKLSGPDASCSI